MILEGRLGSGWRGFGHSLRKILKLASLTNLRLLHRIQSELKVEVVVVAADRHQYHDGARNNGKEKVMVFQNLKSSNSSNSHRDQGKKYSGNDAAQFGANILSNINVISKRDLLIFGSLYVCSEAARGSGLYYLLLLKMWASIHNIMK